MVFYGRDQKRIEEGRTTLGIEFGSTRVKAVLVDETFQPIASGNYRWENQLVDGCGHILWRRS